MRTASRLKSADMPMPFRGPQRRELTARERAMNVSLLGDPDPARRQYAEQIHAQLEMKHQADIEGWRERNRLRRGACHRTPSQK